jgi:hypothetical protein
LLPLIGRHSAQSTNRAFHHLATLGRKAPHLLKQSARLLFLLGSEVLPSFHAFQDPVLLLRRQCAETFQPLAQPVLPLRRQAAELRIAVERFLLFLRRNVFVFA